MTNGAKRRVAGRRMVAMAVAGLLASALAPPSPARAAVAVPKGSGSTFAQIALDQWRAEAAIALGIRVEYSALGSTAGRTQFLNGSVDFASSDIGFEPEEKLTRPFVYLPIVAGGTGLMYNLKDRAGRPITDLRLSGRTVARIFTGDIRNWGHPDILADNPHLADRIPTGNGITAVVRSGGSGTTAVFTAYMARVAPDVWGRFAQKYNIRGDFTSSYPEVDAFAKQSGSDGIANFVATPGSGANSIGYAEAGFAIQRGLPLAFVRNEAGNWTQPTARNVAVALTQAVRNPDGTQNLDRVYFHNHPETYAISSYNYLIAPTAGFDDPAKGDPLGKYIVYSVTEGQGKAARLGYSPLPPNLVQQALDAVRQIPGAPEPPPLGNWGRFYEQLEVSKAPDPTPSGPGVQTGASTGGAADPAAGRDAGAPGTAGNEQTTPAEAAAKSAASGTAAPGTARGTTRARGQGPGGGAPAGGAPEAAAGAEGTTAPAPGDASLASGPAEGDGEVAIGDGRPVRSVGGKSAWPMFLVALALLLVIFGPALVGTSRASAAAGAVARRMTSERWPWHGRA